MRLTARMMMLQAGVEQNLKKYKALPQRLLQVNQASTVRSQSMTSIFYMKILLSSKIQIMLEIRAYHGVKSSFSYRQEASMSCEESSMSSM